MSKITPVLSAAWDQADSFTIEAYKRNGGYQALAKALDMKADDVINIVKESMRSIDIIFLLNYDESIKVVDDGVRDTDVPYIKEVDNIFNALYEQYTQNYDADIFFPKNDSPGLIKLPANIKQTSSLCSKRSPKCRTTK